MKYTNDTSLIQTYLDYCKYNKRLDEKTVKAYAIDLRHFYMALPDQPLISRTPQTIESYISSLHTLYNILYFYCCINAHSKKVFPSFSKLFTSPSLSASSAIRRASLFLFM